MTRSRRSPSARANAFCVLVGVSLLAFSPSSLQSTDWCWHIHCCITDMRGACTLRKLENIRQTEGRFFRPILQHAMAALGFLSAQAFRPSESIHDFAVCRHTERLYPLLVLRWCKYGTELCTGLAATASRHPQGMLFARVSSCVRTFFATISFGHLANISPGCWQMLPQSVP
jgi:hypothetical protein